MQFDWKGIAGLVIGGLLCASQAAAGTLVDVTASQRDTVEGKTTVQLNGELRGMEQGDRVELPLANGPVAFGTVESRRSNPSGTETWVVALDNAGGRGRMILTQTRDGHTAGWVKIGKRDWTIRPAGETGQGAVTIRDDGPVRVIEPDAVEPMSKGEQRRKATTGGVAKTTKSTGTTAPTRKANATSTIRVVIGYTPAITDEFGGTDGVQAYLDNLIATANDAYATSNGQVQLSLVAISELDYKPAPGERVGETLDHAQAGRSVYRPDVFAKLYDLRTEHRAEFIGIIREKAGPDTNGGSATGIYSGGSLWAVLFGATPGAAEVGVAHEVGHLLSGGHPVGCGGNGGFDYSNGYVAADGDATIMGTGDCIVRHMRLSNPDQQCAGAACGDPDTADLARAFREVGPEAEKLGDSLSDVFFRFDPRLEGVIYRDDLLDGRAIAALNDASTENAGGSFKVALTRNGEDVGELKPMHVEVAFTHDESWQWRPGPDVPLGSGYELAFRSQADPALDSKTRSSFTIAARPPSLKNVQATDVRATSAVLSAEANARASYTTAQLSATAGSTVSTPTINLVPDASWHPISATLTGLDCGTSYSVEVTADNEGGSASDTSASFTTSACSGGSEPASVSLATDAVASNSAVLTLTADAGGEATEARVEYGPDTGYGRASETVTVDGSGAITVDGLACETTYHARGVAATDYGASVSGDMTFTTGSCAPGALSFVETEQFVDATDSQVEMTVERNSGTAGTVSVQYTTQDGIADAGTHYAETTGTLTWGPDETQPKTVTVPLKTDDSLDQNRDFKVGLHDPEGGELGGNEYSTTTIRTVSSGGDSGDGTSGGSGGGGGGGPVGWLFLAAAGLLTVRKCHVKP